jgi:hypothetical protein
MLVALLMCVDILKRHADSHCYSQMNLQCHSQEAQS